MELFGIVLYLLFVATSIVSGVTLWVSEHELRVHGLGVLLLLSPTLLGVYLWKHYEWEWLIGTSVVGILIQLFLIKKLAEIDS